MITPKYRHISQKKIEKNRMSYLMKDLERSKMAVENITKFSAVQDKYKQQIENVQQDLQSCIMSIALENKKQRVLSQLIFILKNQMLNYQNTKKKEEQAEQTKKDKMIGKYQYEIDQILQKHNQQIAKIHSLKDMANSNRSERVVYSSLFKKLQKQIKYYQQIYKDQLMHGKFMSNSPRNIFSDTRTIASNSHKEHNINEQKNKYLEESPKLKKQKTSIKQQVQPWKGFITVNKEQPQIKTSYQKKFYSTFQQQQMSKLSLHKQQKFAYTKQLLRQIAQYNNFVEKLKVYAECCSVEEMVKYYSQIEEQNKVMLTKIMQHDRQIEQVKKITQQTSKKAFEEDAATKITQQEELQNDQNYNKSFLMLSKVTEDNQYLNQKFDSIAKLIFLENEKESQIPLDQYSIKLMDSKIQQICKSTDHKANWKDRQETTYSETVVQNLLQKMQKFNNCEKILDRGLLQQEYYKQLSKKKQIKLKRQTSK